MDCRNPVPWRVIRRLHNWLIEHRWQILDLSCFPAGMKVYISTICLIMRIAVAVRGRESYPPLRDKSPLPLPIGFRINGNPSGVKLKLHDYNQDGVQIYPEWAGKTAWFRRFGALCLGFGAVGLQ